MAVKRDPFKVLGIDRTKYTDAELKQVYLDLIRKYNPETRPEKFEEIRTAYNIVKSAKSPYDILAISLVEMTESNLSKAELAAKIEDELGIQKQKISFKKSILLKKLEEIVNDSGN